MWHMITGCPTSLVVGQPGSGRRSRPGLQEEPSHRSGPRGVPEQPYGQDLRFDPLVQLGYARVSTAKQDLDRQMDALTQAGIAPER